MPVVSITRLRVRSRRYLPGFLVAAFRSGRQVRRSDGNLGIALLNDRRMTFWTKTVWESEEAMKAFMHASPHGPVMKKLLNWCDEAALVHWTQDEATLPSWEEAYRRIQAEGRRSKVNHPSPAHVDYRIDAPRVK